MSFHKCGHPDCKRRIHSRMYVCRMHWQFVPQQLKGQLYAAWGIYQRAQHVGLAEELAALTELRRVQSAVIDAISERKGGAA